MLQALAIVIFGPFVAAGAVVAAVALMIRSPGKKLALWGRKMEDL